jgi:hypothetical protein
VKVIRKVQTERYQKYAWSAEAGNEFKERNFQIMYNGRTMDKGSVSSHVNGDTLIGMLNYLSRDNIKSTEPIALLKKNGKLQLGSGKSWNLSGATCL